MKKISFWIVLGFLFFLAASPAQAVQGPYISQGKQYYVVDGNNPNLSTGAKTCAAIGMTCVGYTDLGTDACQFFHPSASVTQTYNGSKAGFYCNGAPQTGAACGSAMNNCQVCPQCNVNADCNFDISGLFREMYVQCASTSTPSASTNTNATPTAPIASKGGWFQSILSYFHNLWVSLFRRFVFSSVTVTTTQTPAPAPPNPTAIPAFKACFVNAGSIASMGPCFGPAGTKIVIQVSRRLKQPLVKVVFKPNSVTGIPGATGAEVIVGLSGAGTTPGSDYTISAPVQLCLGGGGTWDAWPIDASGHAQGDIGRFGITGCK